METDRRPLPGIGRTLPVHQPATCRRIQGRRLERRIGPDAFGRPGDRRGRCGLLRPAQLAARPRAAFSGLCRDPNPSPAASHRPPRQCHPTHDEQRVCRVLRHRHGPPQRGQTPSLRMARCYCCGRMPSSRMAHGRPTPLSRTRNWVCVCWPKAASRITRHDATAKVFRRTTTAAYATQRQRWAYGAMQILRKHWRALLPFRRGLSGGPEMAVHRRLAHMALRLCRNGARHPQSPQRRRSSCSAFSPYRPPPWSFRCSRASLIMLLHTCLLYYRRVTRSPIRIAAAAAAAMSLQFTVARAVLAGLRGRPLPFRRTPKGGAGGAALQFSQFARVLPECILATLLVTASALLLANNPHDIAEQTQFALLLAVQGLPFCATVALRCLEIGIQIRSAIRRSDKPAAIIRRPAFERAVVRNRR